MLLAPVPPPPPVDRATKREASFGPMDGDEGAGSAQAPRRWWASFDSWRNQNAYEGFVLA